MTELKAAETTHGAVCGHSFKILCPDPLTLSLHGRMWPRCGDGNYRHPLVPGVRTKGLGIMAALFTLGQIVVRPQAALLLKNTGVNPASLFLRHVTGDWGDVSADQRRANEEAVLGGGRIFSAYGKGNLRIYVITESDRSVTTILSVSEAP